MEWLRRADGGRGGEKEEKKVAGGACRRGRGGGITIGVVECCGREMICRGLGSGAKEGCGLEQRSGGDHARGER